LELDPDLPYILADPTELQQVFLNLLTNAAQAIAGVGRPGRVTVRARASGGQVLVEVEDDGPGIPAARLEQVFEPCFTTKPAGLRTCRTAWPARPTASRSSSPCARPPPRPSRAAAGRDG